MTQPATSLPAIAAVAAADAPLTMSSRDISDLVKSRHDKVKQSIERLAARGAIDHPPSGNVVEMQQQPNGSAREITTKVYLLGKRDSFVVVAQLSPEFTARLVDRWQELEARVASAPAIDLNDPAQLRRLLLAYSDKATALEQQVQELRPSAIALDRIAQADGSLCITDAAKALQLRPTDLFAWLRRNGWIYRRPGGSGDLGYQAKVLTGLLEHKVTTVLRADGSEKVTEQGRVTAKGLTRLAQLVPSAVQVVK